MTEARATFPIALRTLLFTVLVPGTVAGFVPWSILQATGATLADASVWRWMGAIPLSLGLAIYGWCVTDFVVAGRGTPAPIDPPTELVVRGLYRTTRNPMYVGVLSVIAGVGWLFGSAPLALYAAVVFACFQTFIVAYEEPTLQRNFGGTYERYCAAVPRWFLRTGRRDASVATMLVALFVLACSDRSESSAPAAPPAAERSAEPTAPAQAAGSTLAYLRAHHATDGRTRGWRE